MIMATAYELACKDCMFGREEAKKFEYCSDCREAYFNTLKTTKPTKEDHKDEEVLCEDCKFFDLEDDAYPCVCCKRAHLYSDPGFDKLGIMFKPKELDEESTEVDDVVNPYDVVNRPKHYCREGAMETIDEMELVFGKEAVMNFCLCNAWKYRARALNKNGEEDLKKSDWYLEKYKELKEGK